MRRLIGAAPVKATATSSKTSLTAMPGAPWIYINDMTPDGHVTEELSKLIPLCTTWVFPKIFPRGPLFNDPLASNSKVIQIVKDTRNEDHTAAKQATIETYKARAIKTGVNFVSIFVVDTIASTSTCCDAVTANKLNIVGFPGAGKVIFNWLFTTLTIRETLYLISDADMKKTDTKLFPQYEYCSINDSRTRPKDAKVQFVALVLTKPQVLESNKVVWTVADKTGVANFYFQHRGPHSQYTWDWVMNLKPGDRKALPRMPMVLVKEPKRIMLAKAPFRATAAAINGTGCVLKQVGRGFSKLGKAIKLGSSSEWVLEADVGEDGKKLDPSLAGKEFLKTEKTMIGSVVEDVAATEKSSKSWDDDASVASTEADSTYNEEKMKVFAP